MTSPALHLDFPHNWSAQILSARPLILPSRNFTYPAQAEEVERGALELLVTPEPHEHSPSAQDSPSAKDSFLATCALGFANPIVPSGVWSSPHPEEICAVAGGYAYLICTTEPQRFTFLEMRPVLAVHPAVDAGLLLFVGHRNILAWGAQGLAWQSPKLSDEGLTVTSIQGDHLHGIGWNMFTDKETPFTLNLTSGHLKTL
ncbi:MAG: hypothetical protein KGN79_09720 [Acidobacteriota bacterium]|nr:hypothetical protein [Acidobacteriota bacterium]